MSTQDWPTQGVAQHKMVGSISMNGPARHKMTMNGQPVWHVQWPIPMDQAIDAQNSRPWCLDCGCA